MPEDDLFAERPLFGGAISATFPLRFQDVSSMRQVPDHQEAFVDSSRDESIVIELLELKHDVADTGSAAWFLQDLASDQDAELLEQSGDDVVVTTPFRGNPAVVTTAIGQMAVSKGRQGREAQNIVKVYVANIRLKDVATDVLVTAYEPIFINPLSESAATAGPGLQRPGCTPMADIFPALVSTFNISDWSLFGQ